jgi:hypothetical protein
MNVERPIRQRALAEMLNGDLGIMERGNRSVNYSLSSILFPINGAFTRRKRLRCTCVRQYF